MMRKQPRLIRKCSVSTGSLTHAFTEHVSNPPLEATRFESKFATRRRGIDRYRLIRAENIADRHRRLRPQPDQHACEQESEWKRNVDSPAAPPEMPGDPIQQVVQRNHIGSPEVVR